MDTNKPLTEKQFNAFLELDNTDWPGSFTYVWDGHLLHILDASKKKVFASYSWDEIEEVWEEIL